MVVSLTESGVSGGKETSGIGRVEAGSAREEGSAAYRAIFRATSVMGGGAVLTMVIRLIRTKVLAVLLGPSGTGLMGLYQQVTGLTATLSGFGIPLAGVRQIAVSAGSGDAVRVAVTERTVWRVAWVTGTLGMALQLGLAGPLGKWTFGDTEHWRAIMVLSVVPFLAALAGARGARIQGLRRIGDLARQGVLGALGGAVSGIFLVWAFGYGGIVPSLVAMAVVALVVVHRYASRIRLEPIRLSWRETGVEARALLRLGFSFMGSGIAATVATYLVAAMISRRLGVEANGLYLAAWALSGLYANFVLQAMGADYYPRLAAVCSRRKQMIAMVNRQAEIALLVAVPGIVATLAFAPVAIRLFYTAEYTGAYAVMRWLILGVFFRLVSWPLGYILLAQGAAGLFLGTELFHQAVYVVLVLVLIGRFGLPGVGAAFALLYLLYSVLILTIVTRLFGFRYARDYPPLLALSLILVVGAFLLGGLRYPWLRYGMGALLSVVAAMVSTLFLRRLMDLGGWRDVGAFLADLAGIRKSREG